MIYPSGLYFVEFNGTKKYTYPIEYKTLKLKNMIYAIIGIYVLGLSSYD